MDECAGQPKIALVDESLELDQWRLDFCADSIIRIESSLIGFQIYLWQPYRHPYQKVRIFKGVTLRAAIDAAMQA